ncbi:ribosome-inactivating family protein [Burkholderia alba]|uniref:ribosome-inactivating family protein n=1 Tax=Burkholderia alba TaxID=2683677 RepID=UPI002B0613C5|nr:ribosome-inactivating family protein [Burkholderia alba]
MSLRLTQGQAYSADIAALRNAVRANGTLANHLPVPVQIPNPPPGYGLSLILNLAYEANGSLAAPPASLYTIGFTNAHGGFGFNVPPVMAGAVDLGRSGSYGSLGYAVAPLPGLSGVNLAASAMLLSNFNGPVPIAVNGVVADALTRFIVALSEAIRFAATEQAIAAALDNGAIYNPAAAGHQARFTAWAGHGIGI